MIPLELTLSKIPEQNQSRPARLRFAPAATSQKFPLQFFFCARPLKKIQKGKGKFMLGSALNSSGGRGYHADDGKAKTIFAGGKGFCFASALFCGIWNPPRRRVREECAADFFLRKEKGLCGGYPQSP